MGLSIDKPRALEIFELISYGRLRSDMTLQAWNIFQGFRLELEFLARLSRRISLNGVFRKRNRPRSRRAKARRRRRYLSSFDRCFRKLNLLWFSPLLEEMKGEFKIHPSWATYLGCPRSLLRRKARALTYRQKVLTLCLRLFSLLVYSIGENTPRVPIWALRHSYRILMGIYRDKKSWRVRVHTFTRRIQILFQAWSLTRLHSL